ncbi:MAG: hypothetical protein ABIO71_07895 [Caldimonas sp.]
MPGLGLSQAVANYQQSVNWSQNQQMRQQQLAQQQRQQATMEGHMQAGRAVEERSRAQWAANGAQGEYKPSDATRFEMAEAIGNSFLRAGDIENYMKNEAFVQAQRQRVRQGAVQQYQIDGDVTRLVQSAYPTIFNGKKIKSVDVVAGGDGKLKGAPSGPEMVSITTDDGEKLPMMPANELVATFKRLADPAIAQEEVKLNFLRAKEELETKGKLTVEQERGLQDRTTEGIKAQAKAGLMQAEQGFKSTESAADRKSREKTAGISAAASRYGADQGLAGAKVRADAQLATSETKGGGGKGGHVKPEKLQEMIERSFGTASSESAFDNKRSGNPTTAAIMQGAQAYLRSNPDAGEGEAINAAVGVLRKRGVKIDDMVRE